MTGILLVNMGGPTTEKEVHFFLKKMFMDPYILPLPKPIRFLLARIISKKRYKKSWKKYEKIGGTPLIKEMEENALKLNEELGKKYITKAVFSYSKPVIYDGVKQLCGKGVKKIKVLPVYPQESFTTTGSVRSEIKKIKSKLLNKNIEIINQFYDNKNFIEFWVDLIKNHINKHNCNNPLLIFSAHSIPQYLVDRGDKYPIAVNKSAELIAKKLKLCHKVTYQSKMGKMKWIGPDTKEEIEKLIKTVDKDIVIIPISFLNENLETLYDLDIELIPYFKEELAYNNISRVKIQSNHSLLIKTFIDIIKN